MRAEGEPTRLRARFLLGLAVAVWALVVVLALPGGAEPSPVRSPPPRGLPTGLDGSSGDGGTGAVLGIAAVVGVLALGLVMIGRNVTADRVPRIPRVVRDLEARDYLSVERVSGSHGGRDWVVRRRRLPDTRLNATERAWYFALFGTGLVTSVLWSQVRAPSHATQRWADSAVPSVPSPGPRER
jgi:hypothetical protein